MIDYKISKPMIGQTCISCSKEILDKEHIDIIKNKSNNRLSYHTIIGSFHISCLENFIDQIKEIKRKVDNRIFE